MTENRQRGWGRSQPEGTQVVVPAAGATPQAPPAKRSNVASGDVELVWRDDLPASLEGLRRYVLATAQRSERWYWAYKTTKARLAVTIQWIAILATGLAGLVPIAAKLTLFAGFSAWLRRQGIA